jgi:predicted metal-binding protein
VTTPRWQTAAASPFEGATPVAADVTVLVCETCRLPGEPDREPRPGSLLAADARRAAEGRGVRVRQAACLGNCPRGLSAAIFRAGCWAYVFGGLGTASGADLVAGAELFATSEDGFLPWRGRPEALKRGLIARIPHPDSLKDFA